MSALATILDGLAFPEVPRWHDGQLYFSDIYGHQVIVITPGGRMKTVLDHHGAVSGLGWLPGGDLLVVSVDDLRLLRVAADGRVCVHADLSGIATYFLNDMIVDHQGRAYVGNVGYHFLSEPPRAAMLARVDPDGSVHAAADGLMLPNGTVITPDGRTLVIAETAAARLTAFNVAMDGALSNRRVWATLAASPDGICLDAEGAIWVASPRTNEVLRVAEGGSVLARIETDRSPKACMLGGNDRRTLYVTTAESVVPDECRALRSGRIEAVRVDVPGAGLP